MSEPIPYKAYTVSIPIQDEGPRCYKQARSVRGRTFWRNYRRDVPGGSTFLDLMRISGERAAQGIEAYMGRELFTTERP